MIIIKYHWCIWENNHKFASWFSRKSKHSKRNRQLFLKIVLLESTLIYIDCSSENGRVCLTGSLSYAGTKRLKSYYKSTCKNIRSHDFEKSWRWVNLECPMYRRNPGIIPLLNNRREVRSSPWNICKASCKTKINSLAGGIFVDVENAKLLRTAVWMFPLNVMDSNVAASFHPLERISTWLFLKMSHYRSSKFIVLWWPTALRGCACQRIDRRIHGDEL